MGDCGYFDEQDRFWFCGRMSQRVVTLTAVLYTIPTEAQFNLVPNVTRCALVGIGPRGQQQPAIVLEVLPAARRRWRNDATLDGVREELLVYDATHRHSPFASLPAKSSGGCAS